MCQMYINAIDMPVYRQNILTHGNGVSTPQMKLKKFVKEVTVIDTAESLKHLKKERKHTYGVMYNEMKFHFRK